MRSLFVASDGFVALNDASDPNHNSAVSFVTGLFNETLKVYSSITEVTLASEGIQARLGKKKAERFIALLLDDSGIVLLDQYVGDLHASDKMRRKHSKLDPLTVSQRLMVSLLRSYGIKDVFTFYPELRSWPVNVWPKYS